MSIETRLPEAIRTHVDQLDVPAPDLSAVTSRGRRIRQRRVAAVGALTIVLVAGLGVGVQQVLRQQASHDGIGPVSRIDAPEGLRAFVREDGTLEQRGEVGSVTLGGARFPSNDLADLATSATTTPYGVLFFDADRRAMLLREDGSTLALAPAPDHPLGMTDPTSAYDASRPLAAWTELTETGATVRLLDFESGKTSALSIDCGSCDDVTVDAIDQGVAFVRTDDGTFTWDPSTDDGLVEFAGPRTLVADARNKVVLYDGPTPSSVAAASWTLVPGPLDSELSLDGAYVLGMSDGLVLTKRGAEAVQVDVREPTSWTFDTDGSVLVVRDGVAQFQGNKSFVYDCEVPSGECVEIATVTDTSSPYFPGNNP